MGALLRSVSSLNSHMAGISGHDLLQDDPDSLQLDIGIIAACAPTLRPLLGTVLKLSTNLNHYREANYYRAGKALDRLPVTANAARGYLRQNTASGDFFELTLGLGIPKAQKWVAVNRANTGFTAVVHNNSKNSSNNKNGCSSSDAEAAKVTAEVIAGEKSGSDEDVIMPAPDPNFKGIVKTTEFRVDT